MARLKVDEALEIYREKIWSKHGKEGKGMKDRGRGWTT